MTFEEWWESRPFGLMTVVFEEDCRKAWNAAVADQQARIDRAKGLAGVMEEKGMTKWSRELLAALDGETKKGGVDGDRL